MAKHYTENQRKYIVFQCQNGCNASQLCKKHRIARSTLYLWIKQYSLDQVIHTPRDIYLLNKEVERLRIENNILRKSGCSAISSLFERLEAISRLRDEYSIHALCKVLEVRRSTYYHHALRSPEKTLVQQQDEVLKPIIAEIFEKSRHSFGARKIRAKLMELGHTISERRTLRLMKELDISLRTDYRLPNSANDREYKYYPNKLKRMFVTAAPNLVWVSDITYDELITMQVMRYQYPNGHKSQLSSSLMGSYGDNLSFTSFTELQAYHKILVHPAAIVWCVLYYIWKMNELPVLSIDEMQTYVIRCTRHSDVGQCVDSIIAARNQELSLPPLTRARRNSADWLKVLNQTPLFTLNSGGDNLTFSVFSIKESAEIMRVVRLLSEPSSFWIFDDQRDFKTEWFDFYGDFDNSLSLIIKVG